MTDNKLRIILKSLSLGFASFIILILFLAGGFILSEGYNVLNPYADTEFAANYSPEKFKRIKVGMKMDEVIMAAGEPLTCGVCDKSPPAPHGVHSLQL